MRLKPDEDGIKLFSTLFNSSGNGGIITVSVDAFRTRGEKMINAHPLSQIKISFDGYQCFKDKQELDVIKPVNVIIGRNNSGKSSVLDVIQLIIDRKVTSPEFPDKLRVFTSQEIHAETRQKLSSVRRKIVSVDRHKGATVSFVYSKERISRDFYTSSGVTILEQETHKELMNNTCKDHVTSLGCIRLKADRNVLVESMSTSYRDDGTGITSVITRHLNNARLPSDKVEEVMLNDLRSIFHPDAHFTRITTQTIDMNGGGWEIYLKEEEKGTIPLSKSGSGLKTVISTLAVLRLVSEDPSKCVFMLEELENNLHPTIQRKLFQFLRDFAVENGCTIFTTTHSHVAIDLFSGDEQVQIYHVQHDGEKSSVVRVNDYRAMVDVLDNIGVKASDLLQANGVIWCEGPSDAVYLQKWIELWSGGRLKNNVHYQCMFYGGGLIRYLGAGEAEGDDPNLSHLIDVLHINKNVVLLADSDKASQDDDLKPNLEKVKSSLEEDNHMCWVTAGREIEQYIPESVLTEYYSKTENRKAGHAFPDDGTGVLDQFEKFGEFRNRVAGYNESTWKNKKVSLARDICPLLNKGNLAGHMDLAEKLDRLVGKLYSWNEMQPDS